MKREYEASIQNADAEADKIVETAKARGTEEYNRILAQAKTDATKKMEEADRTIALEREKAHLRSAGFRCRSGNGGYGKIA